jgi:DNA-binding Lrp family transcriptional regulator
MVKNSKEKTKADEQIVIEKLMEDARQSPHEIAEQCGFSRQKVWRIINKVEDNNKLWGYTTVVDDNYDDSNTYYALIKTKALFGELIEKATKKITSGEHKAEELGITLSCFCYLNGEFDWIMIFSAKNLLDAKVFVGFLRKEYDKFIDHISLMSCVFPLIKMGKINPNIEQLKEFAIE